MRRSVVSVVTLVACSALGCLSDQVRCQPGYEPVPGSSPLRCEVRRDGGDAGGDADAGEVGVDMLRPMCGDHVCDDPGDGVDTNGDMVDGELSDTIFVAESGNDMATGILPDQPVRSLPAALALPAAMNRGTILMQVGLYDTSGAGGVVARFVGVERTVRVIGRYTANGATPQWIARAPFGAAGETRITGPTATPGWTGSTPGSAALPGAPAWPR